jgi:P pilus assembly chaperone PapD
MRRILLLIALLSCQLMASVQAAIIMVGTRVIYDESSREVTLRISNTGDSPVVIQSWLDTGDTRSSPDTSDAPFAVVPSVTKVLPKQGQSLRMVFTGDAGELPTDMESVFFLNVLEIPSIRSEQVDQNKLVLLTRHRVKVFYRPSGIAEQPSRALERLSATRSRIGSNQTQILVRNPTPYHVSFRRAEVVAGEQSLDLGRGGMIEPFSSERWVLEGDVTGEPAELRMMVIDDHGGNRVQSVSL